MQKRCYFGCEFKGPLHSFPSPNYPHEDRFNKWKSVLSEDTKNRGNSYIYGNIRLCGRHFEPYYNKTRGNRLTANSAPTLNLFQQGVPASVLPEVEPQIADNLMISSPTATGAGTFKTKSKTQKVIGTHKFQQGVPASVLPEVEPPIADNLMISSPTATGAGTFKTKSKTQKVIGTHKYNMDKELSKLQHSLIKMQSKCKTLRSSVRKAEKISKNVNFLKVIEKFPEPLFSFMKMQQQFKKRPKGRRFSIDEKIFALTIYKQSQKAYNFMRKVCVLPSKRSLQKVLKSLPLKPGINDVIIDNLKKTVEKLTEEQKLCTLIFDEVALTPGLYYSSALDEIIGLEDFGDHKTKKIADHALVFLIKGIKAKYKQPICFTFCQSSTKKDQLKSLIKLVIRQVNSTGLKIVATICDQGGPNMSAINSLINETKANYIRQNKEYTSLAFEVDDIKVFPLFDPPHLLKGVRNNFIDKDVRFVYNGEEKIAKWEHLRMLLDIDAGEDDIRLLNKLTELHVDKEKLPKMKVKYAAQIFSQRVSGALRFLAKHNILPKECGDTAEFLLIMDKLFDSFNGHSYKESAKKYKSCVRKNSIHFKLWEELEPILKSIQFKTIVKKRDGSTEIKHVQVPSVINWINNIKRFKEMFKYLNEEDNIKSLLTRNFNQDPLENFFSNIRSNGVRNVSPTCCQFVNAFKTLLINNFSSVHAVGANCEEDKNKPLQSLKHLLINELKPKQDLIQKIDIAPMLDVLRSENTSATTNFINEESKRYVSGFVLKKCKRDVYKNCKTCNNEMSGVCSTGSYIYERDVTKKSLNVASENLHKSLTDIYNLTNKILTSMPESQAIKENIKMQIATLCDFGFLTCNSHKKNLTIFLINLAINIIIIHSWCTSVNRILLGKIKHFDRGDSLKLQAEMYYKIHKHNKKK